MKTTIHPIRKTMLTTVFLSIILAISGMHHGFFEILQGNKPTPAIFIDSIGENQKTWEYGGDGAMTLIPNLLYTGITAMGLGLLIVLWTLGGLQTRRGPHVLLLLFVLLTLTGGGIGHIPFFLMVWIYTAIRQPSSTRLQAKLPGGIKRILAAAWLPATLLSGLLFLVGLEISVFGYVPGTSDPDQVLSVCWGSLLLSFVTLNIAYISSYCAVSPDLLSLQDQ